MPVAPFVPLITTIGGIGATLLSGNDSADAARGAANVRSQSTGEATAIGREMYGQNIEQLAPWREAGLGALGDFQNELGNYAGYVKDPSSYEQSPGYNWLVNQGVGAIDRGASATGKLDSGQRSKDLMEFGQGLASQDYGNFMGRYRGLLDRYSNLAGAGQNAANQMGQYGVNFANQASQNTMAGADAQARGMYDASNARTGMYSNLSQIASNFSDQRTMQNTLGRNNAYQQSINTGGLYNQYDQNAYQGADWSNTNW